jgi:hypothetical protein
MSPASHLSQGVRTRLRSDTVIWIVTVGADGRPQPSPVGFCQDGGADSTELVIYSRPDARRVVVDDDHPAIKDWPPYLEKYCPAVERAFGSIVKFSESYPIALRVTITGVRGFYQRG